VTGEAGGEQARLVAVLLEQAALVGFGQELAGTASMKLSVKRRSPSQTSSSMRRARSSAAARAFQAARAGRVWQGAAEGVDGMGGPQVWYVFIDYR
jgi:hypothetical protein